MNTNDSDTIAIKVTVIGTPGAAMRAIQRLNEIGPSLAEAMLALARPGGRP